MRHLPLPKRITGDISLVFVIIMILTLVVLAAVIYPEYTLFTRIATKTPYDMCKQSVNQAALMRLGNIELSPFLKCQTEQITIKEKDEEAAKKKIADAMYNCYYQFGRGEKELFSGSGTFCFVCSTIDFEDAGKKITQLTEFNKYLFENYANTKETHAQYLYKDQTEKTRETLKKTGEYTKTRPVQKLGIIFTYDRGLTSDTKWDILKGGAVGGAGAIIAIALAPISVPTILATAIVAGGAYAGGYGVYTLGEFTRLTGVTLKPYSADELNKLGCTQNIVQKPT